MEKHLTFPVYECFGVGKRFSSEHGGVDLSWWNDRETPLIACKSGKIVWSQFTTYGGNVIALEMPYDDTSKQWCIYQHCKSTVALKDVKQGEHIGNMGNTGVSQGNHLHFTLCEPVSKDMEFNYQYAINHVIDPLPHILYRLKGVEYILNDKKWSGGTGSEDLKKIVEFENDEPIDDDKIAKLEAELKEANERIVELDKLLINYDKTLDLIEENMNEILNGIKSVRALL